MALSRLRSIEKRTRDRLNLESVPSWRNIFATVLFFVAIFFVHKTFLNPGMFLVHDGEIHIVRAIHFWQELQHGQFPVRVVPDSAFYYGYSLFAFFYPLPYYVAVFFQSVGLSTVESWKSMEVLISILSLWAMYQWLRCHFSRWPALVGTWLYLFVPYRLLTLYVTGQIGGLYSLLWAPALGWGLYQLLVKKSNWGGVVLSVAIFGLITSHFLSVVIMGFALSGYALWLLVQYSSWRSWRQLILWSAIGVGLSAFYLLPFLLERSWIRLGHGILVDHREHWPTLRQILYSPWGYGYSGEGDTDGMSFQVGLALWAAAALSISLVTWSLIRQRSASLLGVIQCVVFVGLVFLLIPWSAPVWEFITPLQYLQYPWRLLAATSVAGVWLAAWAVSHFGGWSRWLVGAGLVFLAVYNSRNYVRAWPTEWRDDSFYIRDEFRYLGSTDISWELLPVTVEHPPKQRPDRPIYPEEIEITVNDRPEFGRVRMHLEVVSPVATAATLMVWNLPVWQVQVDGSRIETGTDVNGEILLNLPQGESKIDVILQRTQVQRVSDIITLTSALLLLGGINLLLIHRLPSRKKDLLKA